MDREAVRAWIEANGEESFSRSSGPGGQNVNKVSTKALLRVSIAALGGVTEEERARLLRQLRARLTAEDELVIQVQDERSQRLNRDLAVDRILEVLTAALRRPKTRHRTKPTRGSQERRLASKKAASQTKRNRGRPGAHEG